MKQKKTLSRFLSKETFLSKALLKSHLQFIDNFGLHIEIDNAQLHQTGKKIIKTFTTMICCLHCHFQNNTELLFFGKQ